MANKRVIQDGPPLDELNKLVENDQIKVAIHIWRMSSSNKRHSTGAHENWDTIEIGGTKLIDRIKNEFGGGVYLIDVVDPEQLTKKLAPSFKLHIDGEPALLPKQKGAYEAAMMDYRTRGGTGPIPQPGDFLRDSKGLPPMRTSSINMQIPEMLDPTRFWSQTPDAIAQNQAAAAQTKVSQLELQREEDRKKYEEERRRMEEREKAVLAELANMREEFRKEQMEARNQQFEKELAALKADANKPPAIDYAALITAVAPMATAWLASTAEREALRQKQEAKSLEIQQKNADNLLKIMASRSANETEGMKAIMPMIIKTLDDKSPKAQATLMSVMSEHQATMLSMIHQIMQSQQPDNPPPWMEIVNEGIGQLSKVASVYAATQAEVSRQSQRESAPVAATLKSVVASNVPPEPDPQQIPPEPDFSQYTATQLADMLTNDPNWPAEMKTDDWKTTTELLHDKRDPAQVAEYLYDLISQLDESETLPEIFDGVYDTPESVLAQWLSMLPISRIDLNYCQQLVAVFGELVRKVDVEAVESPVEDAPHTVVDSVPDDAQENQAT